MLEFAISQISEVQFSIYHVNRFMLFLIAIFNSMKMFFLTKSMIESLVFERLEGNHEVLNNLNIQNFDAHGILTNKSKRKRFVLPCTKLI